jgi:hypothetical protein
MTSVATTPDLDAIYTFHATNTRHATAAHLARLRHYATGCDLAVEFGVKHGATSAALLMGAKRLISYDLVRSDRCNPLLLAAGARWSYITGDSREAPVVDCDLLFIDSLHTYAQVDAELSRHASHVHRWLIFHDSITFGSVGADGETGQPLWSPATGTPAPPEALGIRPAIDQLMMRDPTWHIHAHFPDSHGLLVLAHGLRLLSYPKPM